MTAFYKKCHESPQWFGKFKFFIILYNFNEKGFTNHLNIYARVFKEAEVASQIFKLNKTKNQLYKNVRGHAAKILTHF